MKDFSSVIDDIIGEDSSSSELEELAKALGFPLTSKSMPAALPGPRSAPSKRAYAAFENQTIPYGAITSKQELIDLVKDGSDNGLLTMNFYVVADTIQSDKPMMDSFFFPCDDEVDKISPRFEDKFFRAGYLGNSMKMAMIVCHWDELNFDNPKPFTGTFVFANYEDATEYYEEITQ